MGIVTFVTNDTLYDVHVKQEHNDDSKQVLGLKLTFIDLCNSSNADVGFPFVLVPNLSLLHYCRLLSLPTSS